ncbi:hypothetical protein OG563_26415 [Nocardia vinacea]|uniref:Uncharacterized protein n=1 Tax=Nocardia vinacea TaxID=96468 RepID=A0ABZ1YIJ0_9NOCA|nr:hypothetical protein [Nocardia vinacea]
MDLLDFFRGHLPWAKLGRFLKQLPAGSRYQAAMELDFDVAEHQYSLEKAEAAANSDEPVAPPTLEASSSAGHDLTVQVLMTIADLIQQLQTTLIAVNMTEGKPPTPALLPRPVSALQVVRARNDSEAEVDEVDNALALLGFGDDDPAPADLAVDVADPTKTETESDTAEVDNVLAHLGFQPAATEV